MKTPDKCEKCREPIVSDSDGLCVRCRRRGEQDVEGLLRQNVATSPQQNEVSVVQQMERAAEVCELQGFREVAASLRKLARQ